MGKYLLLIILFFLICGVLFAARIPPFEGPDESQHFAYITWLAEGRGLPPQGAAAWDTPIEQEAGQPPFYYFLASLAARIVGVDNPQAVYRPNPYFVAPLPREVTDNDNRAIHYPTDASVLRGGWLAFYVARGLTLAFGVLLIVSVYGLTQQVWPDQTAVSLVSAFLAAAIPQVVYISSMVSNDVPAAALSTLTLWLFAIYLRDPSHKSPAWTFFVGAILGLAGLTKVSGITLIVPLGLGLAWLWLSRRRTLQQVVWAGSGMGSGLLTTAGWWFMRNWRLYGSFAGLESHDLTPWAITDPAAVNPLVLRWLEVVRSFWLALGWGTIRPGPWPGGWVYTVFFGLMGLAIIGWALRGWRWQTGREERPSAVTRVLLLLLLLGLLIVGVLLEQWMRRVIAPYGRLLFPAIGGIAIMLVLGWRSLHRLVPWAAAGFAAACTLLTPFTLIPSAYHHTLLTAAEVDTLPPAIGWEFAGTDGKPFARLIHFAPEERSLPAESILPVTVCWEAVGTVENDYTVLLQIIGPENSLISSRRTYPGQGLHPTSIWQTGEVWCDILHIYIPDDAPQTQIYRLELALFDEATKTRLPTVDKNGVPVPHHFLDAIRIETSPPPELATDLSETPPIQLVNAAFAPAWQAGTDATLELRWAAAEAISKDYQVFVHLRSQTDDAIIVQADGPPRDGWYPTSWWPVGEIVTDERVFPLAADAPAGDYRLVVGFYDLDTGQRLGPDIALGTVQVVP